MKLRCFVLLACGCGSLLGLAGCNRHRPEAAPPGPLAVPVAMPVVRDVTDYVDFTGRAQAVNPVNVVPRVTGYLLDDPSFKEGSDVKKGDKLFQIDPRPYRNQYDQSVATVNLNKAQLDLAQANLARDEDLQHRSPGAISAQQLDTDRATVAQANASVKNAEASLKTSDLNLSFCDVTSLIDGQTSRYYVTKGNLVSQDQTLLTTVVSLDPIYAYCDVDEPTVLRVRRAINDGTIKPYERGQLPIFMELPDESGYPHEGRLDFANNQVNPSTGTLLVRGIFDNPLPKGGRRLIMPGNFVRIRLPIGQPHKSLLVIDRAILSDQDLKTVYVIDANNTVQSRRVTVGSLQSDGLRVIADGLSETDRVLVGALQQVRPGTQIQPEILPMPSFSNGRAAEPVPAIAGAAREGPPKGTATALLSALGADAAGGEPSLTYAWSATAVPDGAAPPTFSPNAANAAKNTTATLSMAGTYGFTVTIAASGNLSTTSTVSLAVPPTLATLIVSPGTASVNPGAQQQFTFKAYDQFGAAMAVPPKCAWTTNVGTIGEGGLFEAQNSPGSGKVTAASGTVQGASRVTVTNRPPTVAAPARATLMPP